MSEYPWNEKNNTFTWLSSLYNPFKRQSNKIVKHTQIIRRLLPNCLSLFDHFVGLALKGLRDTWNSMIASGNQLLPTNCLSVFDHFEVGA